MDWITSYSVVLHNMYTNKELGRILEKDLVSWGFLENRKRFCAAATAEEIQDNSFIASSSTNYKYTWW